MTLRIDVTWQKKKAKAVISLLKDMLQLVNQTKFHCANEVKTAQSNELMSDMLARLE